MPEGSASVDPVGAGMIVVVLSGVGMVVVVVLSGVGIGAISSPEGFVWEVSATSGTSVLFVVETGAVDPGVIFC